MTMNASDISGVAKNLKAVVFDGDGVLFTGSVFMDAGGERLKERSFADGQGISMLRAAGIMVAFVSVEATGFLEAVGDKFNNLPSVKSGQWPEVGVFVGAIGQEKTETVGTWLKTRGIDWSECAYMGDDMGDYEILKKAGLSAAPAQAEEIIKKICLFVARRRGGDGAIRDLVNFILDAKGVDVRTLNLR